MEEKIEKVVRDYRIANELKYIVDDNQTVASHLYGSMILATALNSELELGLNLGEMIKTMVFDKIRIYDESVSVEDKYNPFGNFNSQCLILDYFLHNKSNIEIEELSKYFAYTNISKKYLSADKLTKISRFYYLNQILTTKERSGWDKTHWNVMTEHIETISEHIYGTIVLSILLNNEFNFDIDIDKVVEMLSVHELGEILIGDITPFDGITKEEKMKIEHAAVAKVVGDLKSKDKIINYLIEFDDEKTKEAKFAHYIDKLEANFQSKIYQDKGMHRSLDDQEGNVVFKSSKIKKIIDDGAKTAFDVWYEWDKNVFQDSEVFKKVLKHIKDN